MANEQQDAGGAELARSLAQAVGSLTIELQAQTDTAATLQSIVEASVELVPGAGCAGISLIEGERVTQTVRVRPRKPRRHRPAKEILMCRENLTAFAVFHLLTRASQSLNMNLVTVARRVVDDHEAALTRPNTPPSPQGSRG
ncbi:MAG TPA: ANTAR domain-containing protein [Mycobacterium sp.]|nr:ANTAR domain-containing protein [Mycobacterium sp.]